MTVVPPPGGESTVELAVERVDAVAQPAQAAPDREVRAADAVVADLQVEAVVVDREAHERLGRRARTSRRWSAPRR